MESKQLKSLDNAILASARSSKNTAVMRRVIEERMEYHNDWLDYLSRELRELNNQKKAKVF